LPAPRSQRWDRGRPPSRKPAPTHPARRSFPLARSHRLLTAVKKRQCRPGTPRADRPHDLPSFRRVRWPRLRPRRFRMVPFDWNLLRRRPVDSRLLLTGWHVDWSWHCVHLTLYNPHFHSFNLFTSRRWDEARAHAFGGPTSAPSLSVTRTRPPAQPCLPPDWISQHLESSCWGRGRDSRAVS
jgi:hypothetical protein